MRAESIAEPRLLQWGTTNTRFVHKSTTVGAARKEGKSRTLAGKIGAHVVHHWHRTIFWDKNDQIHTGYKSLCRTHDQMNGVSAVWGASIFFILKLICNENNMEVDLFFLLWDHHLLIYFSPTFID
jgi:hypothetical protein